MQKIHDFDLVFDSVRLFRIILKAMSNPLKVFNIKEFVEKMYGDNPEFLAIALTLLDNEVSFNSCENNELSEQIIYLTLCKRETLHTADYVFVKGDEHLQTVIENVKCGTLENPHKSATVIVSFINNKNTKIKLIGAGIDNSISIMTDKIINKCITLRDNRFFEYPEGIDFIFIDQEYNLFSIPRLTKREVL